MNELSSQVVETGALEKASAADAPNSVQANRVWPRRDARGWHYALLRRMLAVADVTAALLASISLAVVGAGHSAQLAWSLALMPVWILVAKLLGLYDRDQQLLRHLTVDEIPQLVLWALIGTALVSLSLDLTPAGHMGAAGAVAFAAVAAVLAFVLRALARWYWRTVTPPERVMVVGAPSQADVVRRKLDLFPDLHMVIAEEADALDFDDTGDPARYAAIDRIVLAPDFLDDRQSQAAIGLARTHGLMLSLVPPCHNTFGSTVQLSHLAELPFLNYRTSHLSRSTVSLKRALDVAVSAAALVVLSPVLVAISIAIRLDTPGPIIYSQTRAGEGGRPFRMRKFRSMVRNAEDLLDGLVSLDGLDEPVFKLRADPRVTRLGRVLRRWSLDELPQLWNVLVGDMSLVGPRPEQVELVERYKPEDRFRLRVKPGITGPMQVYGRGELTFAERLALERDYIENLSLGRDIYILVMTIVPVISGRGAY